MISPASEVLPALVPFFVFFQVSLGDKTPNLRRHTFPSARISGGGTYKLPLTAAEDLVAVELTTSKKSDWLGLSPMSQLSYSPSWFRHDAGSVSPRPVLRVATKEAPCASACNAPSFPCRLQMRHEKCVQASSHAEDFHLLKGYRLPRRKPVRVAQAPHHAFFASDRSLVLLRLSPGLLQTASVVPDERISYASGATGTKYMEVINSSPFHPLVRRIPWVYLAHAHQTTPPRTFAGDLLPPRNRFRRASLRLFRCFT
jgi:hypothetical protein